MTEHIDIYFKERQFHAEYVATHILTCCLIIFQEKRRTYTATYVDT